MAITRYLFVALLFAAIFPFSMPTSHCEVSATDMTLVSGAIGKDVVLDTVNKIEDSMIFPENFGFLRRMAAVQTNDGTSAAPARGGIWGVGMMIFNDVDMFMAGDRRGLELAVQFEEAFCFNWYNNVREIDALDIPLYSALAVMIRLTAGLTDIPNNIVEQALIWRVTFNSSGDTERFIEIAEALINEGIIKYYAHVPYYGVSLSKQLFLCSYS